MEHIMNIVTTGFKGRSKIFPHLARISHTGVVGTEENPPTGRQPAQVDVAHRPRRITHPVGGFSPP